MTSRVRRTTPIQMTCKRGTLIVVVGPTGSGKTDVSIELAQRFAAPIISTDSRQVFRGMAIGSAQPTEEQLRVVRHYFIADREVSDEYNAGLFEKEALELLETLFADHEYVVAVGGSGLYIDALCGGFDALPAADTTLRAELEAQLRNQGIGTLLEELKACDPEYYEVVDRSNPARVLRAVEVCRQTGHSYSSQRKGCVLERPFEIIKVGIDIPREELYERINRRVELMMEAGLEHEARLLFPFRTQNALQTVGYKELFDYFDGTITRDEAVELIKRNSRRYAKRQMTWFRRSTDIEWIAKNNFDFMKIFIKKFAE